MIMAAEAFVSTEYGVSLKEVGYVNVGLDDYYQVGSNLMWSFAREAKIGYFLLFWFSHAVSWSI